MKAAVAFQGQGCIPIWGIRVPRRRIAVLVISNRAITYNAYTPPVEQDRRLCLS
jgi:hypothetical protein